MKQNTNTINVKINVKILKLEKLNNNKKTLGKHFYNTNFSLKHPAALVHPYYPKQIFNLHLNTLKQ